LPLGRIVLYVRDVEAMCKRSDMGAYALLAAVHA